MGKINNILFWSAIFVSTLFYSFNLFIPSDFRVDHYLYAELIQLSNPIEYIIKLFQGKIYDLQPIRDLFLWLDILGSKIFGFWFKILMNIILLFVLIYQASKLAQKFHLESKMVSYLLFLNPVLLHVTGIDTAKKHIISAIFILLFLNQIYGKKRNEILASFYLVLSLLSQPINIFLGFIPAIEKYIRHKTIKKNLKFIILCVCIAMLNWFYYHYAFSELAGVSKYYDFQNEDKILALGRYFVQIVFPYELIYFYDKGSILNFVGITCSVLIMFPLYKTKLLVSKILYIVMFWGAFFVINTQTTQIFHQDTYLIIALIAFVFLLTEVLCKMKEIKRNSLLILIGIFYLICSSKMLMSKRDYGTFIKSSVESNPSCRNVYNASRYYFTKKKISTMLLYGEEMLRRKCIMQSKEDISINRLMNAEILLYTNQLSEEQKEKILMSKPQKNEVDVLILMAFYAQKKNDKKFIDHLKLYNDHFASKVPLKRPWVNDIIHYCEKKQIEDCDIFE